MHFQLAGKPSAVSSSLALTSYLMFHAYLHFVWPTNGETVDEVLV